MVTGKKYQFLDKFLKVIIILCVLALIVYVVYDGIYTKSYAYSERLLKVEASKYVNDYSNLTYLDNYTLKVKIKDTCSSVSGVFIDNGNIYPYLKCNEYETKLFKDKSSYYLNGDKIMFLPINFNYYELGVSGINNVKAEGILNNKSAGVYKLNYKVTDGDLTRYVIVTNNPEIVDLYPKINLKGESLSTVIRLNEYSDLGVYAYDRVDGDLSSKVRISGKVDTSNIGDYNITYSITNSRGYSNQVTRKVSVVNEELVAINNSDISSITTNSSIPVYFIISGDNYSYSILPDGKMTYDKVFTYFFDENGTYKITSYSKDDTHIDKDFVISTINKDVPKGTCDLYNYYSYSKILTNISSNETIAGFKYVYNNSETEFINKSSMILDTNLASAKVIVKNVLGSASIIDCKLNDYSYDPSRMQDPGTPRSIYTNSGGKQVLSGFVGLFQSNYWSIPFKSTGTLGNVSSSGCSIVSFTQIISGFVRKADGSHYDIPDTIKVYNSVCSAYCSGDTAARKAAKLYGLSTSATYNNLGAHKNEAISLLKQGGALMLRVGGCPYATGGHLMSIQGISDDSRQVFLADTSGGLTSRGEPRNQWVDLDRLIKNVGYGNQSWFMAIGPNGMYHE